MIWVVAGILVLIIALTQVRKLRYWAHVRSIKDPEKRMAAEITYRNWKRGRRL